MGRPGLYVFGSPLYQRGERSQCAPRDRTHVLETSQHALEYWTKKFQETQDSYAQQAMTESAQEVNRLIQEIASLKKLLGIGE